MTLSGISTTISSTKEPKSKLIPLACVKPNNASPQTLPVVPPQNKILSGVEMHTATSPATMAVITAPTGVLTKSSRAKSPTKKPIPALVSE